MELGNLLFGNSRGELPLCRSYQDDFVGILNALGFHYDGHPMDTSEVAWNEDEYGFVIADGNIIIRPYYWGDDEKLASLPNFHNKSSGFQVSWYKYPLRDSYCNQEVKSVEDLKQKMFAVPEGEK